MDIKAGRLWWGNPRKPSRLPTSVSGTWALCFRAGVNLDLDHADVDLPHERIALRGLIMSSVWFPWTAMAIFLIDGS